jgi:hypothetical protein
VEDSVNSDIGDDEMIVWEDQHIQHKGCFAWKIDICICIPLFARLVNKKIYKNEFYIEKINYVRIN